MMIIIWIVVGYGIYHLISNKGIFNINYNRGNNAEEILKVRYVNEEIDEVTYERMKRMIKN